MSLAPLALLSSSVCQSVRLSLCFCRPLCFPACYACVHVRGHFCGGCVLLCVRLALCPYVLRFYFFHVLLHMPCCPLFTGVTCGNHWCGKNLSTRKYPVPACVHACFLGLLFFSCSLAPSSYTLCPYLACVHASFLASAGHDQAWRRLRTAWLGKKGVQSSTGVRRARSTRRGPGGGGW